MKFEHVETSETLAELRRARDERVRNGSPDGVDWIRVVAAFSQAYGDETTWTARLNQSMVTWSHDFDLWTSDEEVIDSVNEIRCRRIEQNKLETIRKYGEAAQVNCVNCGDLFFVTDVRIAYLPQDVDKPGPMWACVVCPGCEEDIESGYDEDEDDQSWP